MTFGRFGHVLTEPREGFNQIDTPATVLIKAHDIVKLYCKCRSALVRLVVRRLINYVNKLASRYNAMPGT